MHTNMSVCQLANAKVRKLVNQQGKFVKKNERNK